MSSNPAGELLEVIELDDKVVVRLLVTALDDSTSHAISDRLLRLAERPDARDMHLDLGRVGFTSSTGLGLCIALHKKLRGEGRRLTVFDVNAVLFEVFEVTHLDKLLDVRRKADG